MRNYVQAFFLKIDFQDMAIPPDNFTIFIVDESPESCVDSIAIVSQSLIDNGFVNPVGTILGPRYYLLDKANFIDVLVGYGAGALWNFPIPSQFTGTGTPRDGWTDLDGVKRQPTPSDKATGSKGTRLVGTETLLQSLQTFAGALVAAGFKNTGPRSLLGQLVPFIIALSKKQKIDEVALAVLLAKIEAALT